VHSHGPRRFTLPRCGLSPRPTYAQVNAPAYHVNDIWKKHQHLPNFAAIDAAAKDTFSALPLEFDPSYRNPCW
jgi:hypothetical protein